MTHYILNKDDTMIQTQNMMEVNELYCIGSNKYGQAGAGKKYHNHSFKEPKTVVFPVFAKQVSCGSHHSALLTIDGLVYAMGSNISGALAIPSASLNYSYSPMLVQGVHDISKICSGYNHILALSQGTLYSWGKGIDGQLGTGKNANSHTPSTVSTLGNDVEDMSCGSNHTIVKMQNGRCYSFGNGIYGQLGIGSNKNAYEPARVKLDLSVDQIAAGQNFSLFLCEGSVYGTGDNSFGQIDPKNKKKCILQPSKVNNVTNVATLRAGKFSAALTHQGEVLIWGVSNNEGIIRVVGIEESISDIEVGGHSIFCLTAEGNLFSYKFGTEKLKEEYIRPEQIKLPSKTILGFSVGEGHAIILGDICGEFPALDQPQKILEVLNEPQSMNSSKLSLMQSKKNLEQEEEVSEEPSISEEHFARTPSSIARQPSNFLKSQKQTLEEVRDFDKDIKEKNVVKESYMKKIQHVMKLLEDNKKLEESQPPSPILSRRHTRSKLESSFNKQNRIIHINKTQRSGQQNKELIMELREKELKISELQEKLSRKQVEIETQRQLIDLLRKFNEQQPS